jgi:hypothetical protein
LSQPDGSNDGEGQRSQLGFSAWEKSGKVGCRISGKSYHFSEAAEGSHAAARFAQVR